MKELDIALELQQTVVESFHKRQCLMITGGGSKSFLGRLPQGKAISVKRHQGIINYQPSELVITARAGTRLSDINDLLAKNNQMLGFEPPSFTDHATLGGAVAAGLSGPRRPYSGSVRDFVLGCKIINGKGEILSFGGEVIKNVAGYDISRLMTGAMGTLGILLEISLKVLPKPVYETTLIKKMSLELAMEIGKQPMLHTQPVSAFSFDGESLWLRLSGSEESINSIYGKIGGDLIQSTEFWYDLNEQRLPFFSGDSNLWRVSVPPSTPPLSNNGSCLYDWGGALRWLYTDEPVATIFSEVHELHGHAYIFRGGDRNGHLFTPESKPLLELNRKVKNAFDPAGILNKGRKYKDW